MRDLAVVDRIDRVDGDLAAVTLAWIPLGSGQRIVRASGAIFEALSAFVHRRHPCALYHSALIVDLPDRRW